MQYTCKNNEIITKNIDKMIDFKNVDYSYSSKNVINNLSFEIEKGGVYGLLGENGTGKTTMIGLMGGMLRAGRGTVKTLGFNSFDKDVEMYKELFIIPEEFMLPSISLNKYIKTYSPFYPKFSHEDMASYIERFRIDPTQRTDRMSMGQRKKCIIAFCFASNCNIMLLDEPTNGLDIPSKIVFRSIIAEKANEDRIILLSTHQIRDIDSILDTLMIIDNDELLLKSTIANIEEKLAFVSSVTAINSIYTESNISIVENNGELETPINIEILFNATITNKNEINRILNK